MRTVEYILPAHWASYLINGDDSGLDDADKRDIPAFLDGKGHCLGCSDISWFARSNNFSSVGGLVMSFTFSV